MSSVFHMEFSGYFHHGEWEKLAQSPGIFCVYAGKEDSKGTATPDHILYIGYANHCVATRLKTHERLKLWNHFLLRDETLCFSSSAVPVPDNARCAAALINYHKPHANREYKINFPFEDTSIQLSGDIFALTPEFTVHSRKHSTPSSQT